MPQCRVQLGIVAAFVRGEPGHLRPGEDTIQPEVQQWQSWLESWRRNLPTD